MLDTALLELPKALALFQSQHHAAGRDSKGNYGTYTSLAGALAAVQPGCAFGLSHSHTLHPLSEDFALLKTTLFHISGESISSELPLALKQEVARGNHWQALGSALTYARRYTLLAIYGLAGDDDDGEISTPGNPGPAAAKTSPNGDSPKAASRTANKKFLTTSNNTPTEAVALAEIPSPEPMVWLDDARRKRIVTALRAFDQKEAVLEAFRAEFHIANPKITPDHIQLPAHGDWLEKQLGLSDADQ